MIIRPEQLRTNSLLKSYRGNDICKIIAAAINAADAGDAVKNHVYCDAHQLIIDHSTYDLNKFRKVFVIGAGKASVPMARAIYELLGNQGTSIVIVTKQGYLGPNKPFIGDQGKIFEASHPIPDQRNLDASYQLISYIHAIRSDDLVICLFSGGGSSLMIKPSNGISLEHIQEATSILLSCGATIAEINTIRKHLDELKGGGLVKLLYPAQVISLILSDVIGDNLDLIASGPTVADSTTFQDAWAILNKYQIFDRIPPQICAHLLKGMSGKIPETIKPGDPILEKVQNVLVGNNTHSALVAANEAKSIGFNVRVLTTSLQGEASEVGRTISNSAKSVLNSPFFITRPVCLIAGGETTVTIKGTGKGGRNQELALGAVQELSGANQIILASLATDGEDGPTDAAGAVATNLTYTDGMAIGLNPSEYLEGNDAYHYFEPLGNLIKTGPTLTNVNDLVFIFGL
jgi:hydroxypyruvate reductase